MNVIEFSLFIFAHVLGLVDLFVMWDPKLSFAKYFWLKFENCVFSDLKNVCKINCTPHNIIKFQHEDKM